MTRKALIYLIATLVLPFGAQAEGLELPATAVKTGERLVPYGDYDMPVGPFLDGNISTVVAQGAVTQQAWRIGSFGQTSLHLINSLKDQLIDDGFDPLFECQTDGCGGFDFRFGTLVMSEPDMHVDLGDFQYFAAHKPGEDQFVSLLVSRSPGAGYLQIIRVDPSEVDDSVATVTSTKADPQAATLTAASPVGDRLERTGHAVLSDLVFETGSSNLGSRDFVSLAQLADYLAAHPQRTVALVGHTDAEGALDSNVALSKRRAASVMQRLIQTHGVDAGQLAAEGVGFLSPLASNLTDEGRQKNRRVEVVLTTTR